MTIPYFPVFNYVYFFNQTETNYLQLTYRHY